MPPQCVCYVLGVAPFFPFPQRLLIRKMEKNNNYTGINQKVPPLSSPFFCVARHNASCFAFFAALLYVSVGSAALLCSFHFAVYCIGGRLHIAHNTKRPNYPGAHWLQMQRRTYTSFAARAQNNSRRVP